MQVLSVSTEKGIPELLGGMAGPLNPADCIFKQSAYLEVDYVK